MVPWAYPSLHPKRHLDQFRRFCKAHHRVPHNFKMGRHIFLQKLPLLLGGSGPPSNTWYLGTTRVIIPNSISISSAVFVWVPNAALYNALSMGKKTPKTCHFFLGFRHPAGRGLSHGHRQHAQKMAKIMRVVLEISLCKDRHTDTNT